jgi:GR25 family glycosyltransferase involved in LPS biosynthesis
MKTYLLHHRDMTERFEVINKRLKDEGLMFDIIDGNHPDDIEYESLLENHESFIPIVIEQIHGNSYMNFSKKISPGSMSLVLKHMDAWKDIVVNNIDNAMILEDDCEIPYGFLEYSKRILTQHTESQFDITMIGTTEGFRSPSYDGQNEKVFHHPLQKTRCTHCYIISSEAAQKMIEGFGNINLPIDFKMNEVIQINRMKIGWVEPGLKQITF